MPSPAAAAAAPGAVENADDISLCGSSTRRARFLHCNLHHCWKEETKRMVLTNKQKGNGHDGGQAEQG